MPTQGKCGLPSSAPAPPVRSPPSPTALLPKRSGLKSGRSAGSIRGAAASAEADAASRAAGAVEPAASRHRHRGRRSGRDLRDEAPGAGAHQQLAQHLERVEPLERAHPGLCATIRGEPLAAGIAQVAVVAIGVTRRAARGCPHRAWPTRPRCAHPSSPSGRRDPNTGSRCSRRRRTSATACRWPRARRARARRRCPRRTRSRNRSRDCPSRRRGYAGCRSSCARHRHRSGTCCRRRGRSAARSRDSAATTVAAKTDEWFTRDPLPIIVWSWSHCSARTGHACPARGSVESNPVDSPKSNPGLPPQPRESRITRARVHRPVNGACAPGGGHHRERPPACHCVPAVPRAGARPSACSWQAYRASASSG